ncbi:MAG: hypothetical protein AAF402_05500 [Pseudomonadota bacterium]
MSEHTSKDKSIGNGEKSNPVRRKVLGIAAAGSITAPAVWKAPVVDSIVLPVHAETTGGGGDPGGGTTEPPATTLPPCLGRATDPPTFCVRVESDNPLFDVADVKGIGPNQLGVDFNLAFPSACCDSGSGSWRILSPSALAGQSGSLSFEEEGDCQAFPTTDISVPGDPSDLIGQTLSIELDLGACAGVCTISGTIIDCNEAF